MSGKNKSAVALGKLGGLVKSEKKANASRQNGRKGGRPKKNNVSETIPQPLDSNN